MKTIKILLVEDFEPFRRIVRGLLQPRREFHVVGEASNGLEAVQKAKELAPDLILLDIGLPHINGMEAARRIRQFAPEITILFVSQEASADVIEEAFRTGAQGYLHKQNARRELIAAIEAVLDGKQFVSSCLDFSGGTDLQSVTSAPELSEIV